MEILFLAEHTGDVEVSRVSYLKQDFKSSFGTRGLSVTTVVPMPTAWRGMMVTGLFSMNTFSFSWNFTVSFRLATIATDTSELGGTTPLLGSILQQERSTACRKSQTLSQMEAMDPALL